MREVLFVIALCGLMPTVAVGQDAPWVGQLSGRAQNSTMSYVCSQQDERLHCQFTQVLFTPQKPMTGDEVDASVSQALQSGISSDTCAANRTQLATLQAGGNFGVALTDDERSQGIQYLSLMNDLCDNFSEDGVRALVRFGQGLTARTCNVGTLPFELDFSWNRTTARWETVSQPNGTCGVVTSAFFEFVSSPGMSIADWTYHQLKTVTNRAGPDDPLLGKCAEYRDDESYFDFAPRTIKVQCDYLQFSMF